MKFAKLVSMLVALVLSAACGNRSNENREAPILKRVESELVIVDQVTGKPFQEMRLGSSIRFVFKLANMTDETLTFNFSSGKQYDFEVYDSSKQKVWSWSQDRAFIQAFTEITLGPKERIEFATDWDQKDNENNQVPEGSYRVTGLIPALEPEIVKSQSKMMMIKD